MTWEQFIYFAIAAVLLWAVGAWAAWREKTTMAYTSTVIGLVVFFSFILMMWVSLERPPLRTMGETRLWYSFFLPLTGIIVYSRWKYKWILTFSTILSVVFICVNLFKPEIHSKTLMPALQSPWFAPHVIVYMFAYAVFGVATLMALWMLIKDRNHNCQLSIRRLSLRRPRLYDHRHALRCPLGKGGVGTLLVVGPQGDVGCHHLARLSRLCALQTNTHSQAEARSVGIACIVCTPADVLVGH